ncbi:MAG TPA: hypothetical protein VHN77_03160 [Phycisphaerales bacterium]|nr:hypothetical protein [Phycisphaerales bacterium]
MPIEHPYYPVVYVRGFAATMGEIEDTVADPFMGFNLGATKIRQNHEGNVVRFIFESPLLRLIKDHGYQDCYKNGDYLPREEQAPARSVWIFRYYERASDDLGEGRRQTIPEIAQDLRRFILRVRDSVCQKDAEAMAKFRVHLVAHSMGGLICRCYLQNLCVYGTGNKDIDRDLEISPRPVSAAPVPTAHFVDKVFTYATPHNGIELLGMNVLDAGGLDAFHVRNFNRGVMREYLRLPPTIADGGESVSSLNGAFPPERFFCLVGTNYNDYTAFFRLAKKGTGPMSDGLVMIKNAAVAGSPRAFVHRSHSGHYGIVNSEEGYQNLRRFLFGNVRVEATLLADEVLLPKKVQEKKDEGHKIRASYQIEATARVRGGVYYLHERKAEQASAILAEYDELVKEKRPQYLFTGYLMRGAKMPNSTDTALAFAVRVSIRVPMYEVDNKFWLDEHFEGGFVYDETVTFFVRLGEGNTPTTVRYGLASERGVGEAGRLAELIPLEGGGARIEISLGFAEGAANPPRPGFRGKLRLETTGWNL